MDASTPAWLVDDAPRAQDVWEMVSIAAAEHANRLAVCSPRNMTYSALYAEIEVVRAMLQGLGAGEGTRIGVMMPNDVRVMQVHFAAAAMGARLRLRRPQTA